MKWKLLQIGTFLVAVGAAYISYNLFQKHYKGTTTPAWFDAACGESADSGANCEEVIKSRWGSVRGIPTALLGMIYYAALAVWTVGVGRPSPDRRWVHLLPGVMIAGGLVFSGFLTYEMFADLEHWCPWCAATHGANVLIAVAFVLMWPARTAAQAPGGGAREGQPGSAAPATPPGGDAAAAGAHPGRRLLVTTLLAILLAAVGLFFLGSYPAVLNNALTYRARADRAEAILKEFQKDLQRLAVNWELEEARTFVVTDQTPVRGGGDPPRQLVVFSDLECPHCRSLAKFCAEEIEPLFAGGLQVVFKHYPLNSKCNPHVKSVTHPRACDGMATAEAARILGGNDAFWRVHDTFFGDPQRLKTIDLNGLRTLAAELGLDGDKFVAQVQSPQIGATLLANVNEAKEAGVTSTPTAFYQGKRVHQLALLNRDFWRIMARRYWNETDHDPPPEVFERLRIDLPAEEKNGQPSDASGG